ncbi:MAG: desaturase [Rhodospirillaceae bacterium]|nr:desaturase [Rhodospirillaceae bacterium]|tara:strand:- start:12015 stop:13022 length:1008 start_codon:yes stop_codon:yes gene_type:complete
MTDTTSSPPSNTSSAKGTWNWHPELPVTGVPYWAWPMRPLTVLKWLFSNFLQFTDRAAYLVFALVLAFWLHPVTPEQASLSFDWTGWILLRNAIALLVVAGGLHMWFYGFNAQGDTLKYDVRPMPREKHDKYTFGYQTWDNMFYSLASGLPIATAWEILARVMYARGVFVEIEPATSPVWFVLMFPLVTMWQSLHFYVVHRALHWTPLYKHIHALHHRNINPGPWSGISMHPVEHVLYFSTILIFFVLPSHPAHMLFVLFWQLLGAPSGHSGYEAVWAKNKARLGVGGFFHQLHHRYFDCNYGSEEFPLDRWLGTFHDGTREATARMRRRQKPAP